MDLIDRQAAIDALYDWSEHSMTDAEAWHIRQVIGDIKSLPPAEPNCSEIPNNSDCISRQTAITAIQKAYADTEGGTDKCAVWKNVGLTNALHIMQDLPSAQAEQTDCDYCHKDSDGYVYPIEKNCHAVIFGSVLYLKANGWRGEVEIKYCAMCGRRLTNG
jgi:hypothetical protein